MAASFDSTIPITGDPNAVGASALQITATLDFGLSAATTAVSVAATNSGSPCRQEKWDLVTTTAKAITIPNYAVGVVIEMPSGNTNLVLMSNTTTNISTLGLALHKTLPSVIGLDSTWVDSSAGELCFYAAGNTTIKVTWF